MESFDEDVARLFSRSGSLELKRYFDGDFLSLLEHVKVRVQKLAVYWVELRVVNERVFVLAETLQGDDGSLACLAPNVGEFAGIHGNRGCRFFGTVEDGGHGTCLAQRICGFILHTGFDFKH